ncbi:MAG: hypothetical protein KDC00_00760 [Flavobacteriales bacterium]|nr:hypothetical protein [Flavobacteriales bacterium]
MDTARHYLLGRSGRSFILLLFLVVNPAMRPAPIADKAQFEIHKGDDVVGRIVALRNGQGDRTTYLMTSYSEFQIIWKQIVRTTMVSEYAAGQLNNCHSNLWVNSALRDSSHMRTISSRYDCFVHPDRRFVHHASVEWTTARMYFEEPIGVNEVFVESVLENCRLMPLGEHRYRLFMPDAKVNDYVYRNGVLQEIGVDRKYVDLVFRRI